MISTLFLNKQAINFPIIFIYLQYPLILFLFTLA